jgi:hypothetical protein
LSQKCKKGQKQPNRYRSISFFVFSEINFVILWPIFNTIASFVSAACPHDKGEWSVEEVAM